MVSAQSSNRLQVFLQLVRRDIASRYQGSLGGYIWAIVVPVLMLAIYSFVFGFVFPSRWGASGDDTAPFVLQLFAGLLVFTIFSESVVRAPELILAHANFVKRVVFPLELLPCMTVVSAIFSAIVQFIVFSIFCVIWLGQLPISALSYPLVLLPVILFTLGTTFLLSALGVYIRDVKQAVGLLVTAMMFLSPIFYPLSAVPEAWQWWVGFSPLAQSIEQTRTVMLAANWPALSGLVYGLGIGGVVAAAGVAFFSWTQKGFADVL